MGLSNNSRVFYKMGSCWAQRKAVDSTSFFPATFLTLLYVRSPRCAPHMSVSTKHLALEASGEVLHYEVYIASTYCTLTILLRNSRDLIKGLCIKNA